jgi:hypothetical protein
VQLSHAGVASLRVVRYVFWGDQRRLLRIGGQRGGEAQSFQLGLQDPAFGGLSVRSRAGGVAHGDPVGR